MLTRERETASRMEAKTDDKSVPVGLEEESKLKGKLKGVWRKKPRMLSGFILK